MKTYWLVRVDFLDHASCPGPATGEVKCTVWGLLAQETETCYHLVSWVGDGEIQGINSEGYAIVKHPGVKLTKIKREKL